MLPNAYAFPELVRKGYGNCITCHVSTTGGGVLTAYGRELSRETLSTWGGEKESQFAYGAVPMPDWLSAGGDFRFLQDYLDNAFVRQANYYFMQTDAEAAVRVGRFTIDGTAGFDSVQDQFISRRHFVQYQANDSLAFRAGRFFPAYGINDANHTLATRAGLGWDQSDETYNLEASWIGETLNFYATAIFGRPDQPSLEREDGVALSAGYYFADRYKTGLSFYSGFNNAGKRNLAGPWGILGFTPKFFLLAESDLLLTSPVGAVSTLGLVDDLRLDYEVYKGLHAFVIQELNWADFSSASTIKHSYGFGTQLFPRPHFDVEAMWLFQFAASSATGLTNFGLVMLHFYL